MEDASLRLLEVFSRKWVWMVIRTITSEPGLLYNLELILRTLESIFS